jgi:preprotein translocase subunit SecF
MLRIFKETKIDFIGFQKWAIGFSLFLTLVTFVSIGYHWVVFKAPFNWSIEFVGGTQVQLKFQNPIHHEIQRVRDVMNQLGYAGSEIKPIGSEKDNELLIIVRKQGDAASVGKEIQDGLLKAMPDNTFEVLRHEAIGPKIGGEMRRDALIAVFLSLIGILIYVWFRFQASFGVAAVIPLFHDVIITIGFFSVLNREFSLTFIAALLTIMGYSLNDNVVIFDRIRENMKKGLKGKSFTELVNLSINQTLSRTIITSGITFVVVTILWLIGYKTSIGDFALAMMIGTIFGTYSTIYIASVLLVWWHKRWPIIKA